MQFILWENNIQFLVSLAQTGQEMNLLLRDKSNFLRLLEHLE